MKGKEGGGYIVDRTATSAAPGPCPSAPIERPVALDLCVGLGGWAEGLVAVGYHVIGVDIEDMFAALGEPKPDHFELVIADICKVRGADYAHVSLIVGSLARG